MKRFKENKVIDVDGDYFKTGLRADENTDWIKYSEYVKVMQLLRDVIRIYVVPDEYEADEKDAAVDRYINGKVTFET